MEKNKQNQGHHGVDPQPNHGKDEKGHKDNGNPGGIVTRPGTSHAQDR
ncbi:hypothetical protein [Ammoniphilus sp. YIM 78166]|nr:hypothetical protein [Ammoniphilus sp. YIM 78166]